MGKRWSGVNRRSAVMTWQEAVFLTALGGKPRPDFTPRDGRDSPAVKVISVLCCFCREYHSPAEVDQCMVLPRKAASVESSVSFTSNALAAGPLKPFPGLWGFLTATCFEDGTSRKTGRLSVSFASGNLALLLTDDETAQYACLNGRNLDDLLADAELRLETGTVPWRPSRYQGRGKRS
jgi:hypothetical protein